MYIYVYIYSLCVWYFIQKGDGIFIGMGVQSAYADRYEDADCEASSSASRTTRNRTRAYEI